MTQAARRRSGLHRAFVATVFVLGLAALADALYTLHLSPVPYLWVGLALLTHRVRLRQIDQDPRPHGPRVSVSRSSSS